MEAKCLTCSSIYVPKRSGRSDIGRELACVKKTQTYAGSRSRNFCVPIKTIDLLVVLSCSLLPKPQYPPHPKSNTGWFHKIINILKCTFYNCQL